MKKFLALFLLVMIAIPSLAKVQWELPRDILIEGSVESERGRSLSFPLEATLLEDQVSVTFFEALSDVTLTITSETGVMQARTVSFIDFQTEILSVSNYPKGEYTLSITTPRGTDLHGSFIIK